MRFGVNILNFGPGTDQTTLAGWARFAEDTGYHVAMISDHVTVTPDVAEQYPAPFYDPFATLAWLAGTTSRIELGTTVAILPYRHPLEIARVTAAIDRFSGGRFILGVGVGWAVQEFDVLGVPFQRRGAITTEYLDVIKRHWTEDVLTYHGEFVNCTGVATGPRPLRVPPVWAGGNSPAAIRRAARLGDTWHPINASPRWVRDEGLPALRAAAGSRPVPDLTPRIQLNVTDSPLGDERPPGHGTLEQIHDDVTAFAALGATYLLFDTYLGPGRTRPPAEDQDMLTAIADHVINLPTESPR